MIKENRASKYLLYAVSEIILVVVGILIALQLNQLKEDRKESIALQILTENLHKEFNANYQDLEVDITRLKRKVLAGNTLMLFTGIKNIQITEFKVDSLIFEAIEIPTWNPSSFVLNDIKNSGKLSSIKSKKLKQLLYNWERLYEDILEHHTSLETSSNRLVNVINNKGSMINVDYYNKDITQKSKFKISNTSLLQEIHFENELEGNVYAALRLLERYSKATVLIKKL